MNITEAIERAIADVLRTQSLGKSVLIRCWHNLKKDPSWKPENDKVFPCIDVRCNTPVPENGSKSLKMATCAITIFSHPDADKNHAVISAIEEGVQTALENLVDVCESENLEVFTAFETSVKADYPSALFINGIEFTDGQEPGLDEGVQSVGFAVVVHYSKANR